MLAAGERIAGRAAWHGRLAVLTTAPALIMVDPATREYSKRQVRTEAGVKLWGLGEHDGHLYSIARFRDVVRLIPSADGVSVEQAGVTAEPLGNLVDTAAGMAGQIALETAGRPLAWHVDRTGSLAPLPSPPRTALKLSRAEESLLHLMSCSVPPRVICWLPGSDTLLRIDDGRIGPFVRIDAVRPVTPAALLARPESRSIEDAIAVSDTAVAVLFDAHGGGPGSALLEYSDSGLLLRELSLTVPLRLLLWASHDRVLAIARSGGLIEVRR
jgi:hypothetical protein